MRTRGPWIWWMVTASAAALAGVLLLVVLAPSDTPAPPAAAAPAEPAEPAAEEPELPPVPEAVEGTITGVELTDLSVTGSGLRPDGSGADAEVAVDQPAVDAAVTAAAGWLDAHLTAAHDGEGGLLPAELDGPTEAVTTGLAHPDRAVQRARYAVTVGVRGVPEWLSVVVTVDRLDGSVGDATFVFAPEDGEVVVVAALPGEGTAPPPEAGSGEPTDLAEAVDEGGAA